MSKNSQPSKKLEKKLRSLSRKSVLSNKKPSNLNKIRVKTL